jgi:hypothetical protein
MMYMKEGELTMEAVSKFSKAKWASIAIMIALSLLREWESAEKVQEGSDVTERSDYRQFMAWSGDFRGSFHLFSLMVWY